jgi:CheY-like chemotaxis protein
MTGQALGILVIEDDRGVRELLCRDLEARGCRVTATNNGLKGSSRSCSVASMPW